VTGAEGSCAAAGEGCSVSAVKVTRTTPAVGRSAFDLNTVSPCLIRSLRQAKPPAIGRFVEQAIDARPVGRGIDASDLEEILDCFEQLVDSRPR